MFNKGQLAGLMKQAQAMQDNMKRAQDELAQMEVEGQSGAGLVKVVMTCKHDVNRINVGAAPKMNNPADAIRRQIELLEAMADVWRKKYGKPTRVNHNGTPYITVRSGHGPGKTHTAALMALTFNTAFPARIICTAPKLAQLRTRVWGAIRKIHARAESWWRSTLVINDTTVYWRDADGRENRNWCILAETASNPENLAGHHERFIMVLVEEETAASAPARTRRSRRSRGAATATAAATAWASPPAAYSTTTPMRVPCR